MASRAAGPRLVMHTAGRWRNPGAQITAAGPLVALLVAPGEVAEGTVAAIEQGHALGRPGRIQVTVSGPQVRVAGSGLVVAEGSMRV